MDSASAPGLRAEEGGGGGKGRAAREGGVKGEDAVERWRRLCTERWDLFAGGVWRDGAGSRPMATKRRVWANARPSNAAWRQDHAPPRLDPLPQQDHRARACGQRRRRATRGRSAGVSDTDRRLGRMPDASGPGSRARARGVCRGPWGGGWRGETGERQRTESVGAPCAPPHELRPRALSMYSVSGTLLASSHLLPWPCMRARLALPPRPVSHGMLCSRWAAEGGAWEQHSDTRKSSTPSRSVRSLAGAPRVCQAINFWPTGQPGSQSIGQPASPPASQPASPSDPDSPSIAVRLRGRVRALAVSHPRSNALL